MRVLVTGATGFIGRALIPLLQREGHSVLAWVRSEVRARSLLGADVEIVRADAGLEVLVCAIERCDAVVNLAGEPVMGGRWTAARRAILETSRVAVTDLLVRAMTDAKRRPSIFISGSAVGYYGDRADEQLTEASAGGDGFLARLCRQWENAAQPAERLGLRIVHLRIGVVLGRAGGALAEMQPPFELVVGGPVGSEQYLPWIHLHDLVNHRRGARRRTLPWSGERRGARAGHRPLVRARSRAVLHIAGCFRCRRWCSSDLRRGSGDAVSAWRLPRSFSGARIVLTLTRRSPRSAALRSVSRRMVKGPKRSLRLGRTIVKYPRRRSIL